MISQLDLLDLPQHRKADPITSVAADYRNKHYSRQSQAGKVLQAVHALGECNASEIDRYLDGVAQLFGGTWRVTTAGRRIPELLTKTGTGYLIKTGDLHKTTEGERGYCVRLTAKGQEWINR